MSAVYIIFISPSLLWSVLAFRLRNRGVIGFKRIDLFNLSWNNFVPMNGTLRLKMWSSEGFWTLFTALTVVIALHVNATV